MNYNNSSYIYFFLFFLLIVKPAQSSLSHLQVTNDNIPIELTILIESISIEDEATQKEVEEQLKKIDLLAENVSQNTFSTYVKIEIYKTVLKYFKEGNTSKLPLIKIENHTQLLKSLKNKDGFAWYIANALTTDYMALQNDPSYRIISQGIQAGPELQSNLEYQKTQKKVRLLQPWIELMSQLSEENILAASSEIKKELLKKLTGGVNFFEKSLHLKMAANPKVSSFQFIKGDIDKRSFEEKLNKIVQDVETDSKKNTATEEEPSNSTENEKEESNIKAQAKNWVPSDGNSKAPLVYPKPDPNYLPPESLPKPVNDWILDL